MNPGQGHSPTQRAVALCAVLAVLPLLACTGARAPAAAPPAQAAPAGPVVRAAAAASPTTEATPVHVTGGLLPSIAGAPILVGVDLGVYQRNGLDVSIETFTSTPQIMTAIAAGQLDFGQVTMGAAAFNAYHRGVDLTIIAAGSGGAVPLVVRKDLWDSGAVRTVQDLRDRTVALNGTGNILEYSLHKVLEHGNLTAADLHIVYMPFPEMVAALQNEAVDAAMMLEPAASTAVARGAGVILEESAAPGPGNNPWYAPGLQAGMLMVNRQWAADNPDAAVALVKSYLETARRVQGTKLHHDDEALTVLEQWTKVKPEVIKQATVTYWAPNGRLDTVRLLDEQRFYIEAGSTDYKDPIPIGSVYTDEYLNAALQQIGTVSESE